jgi:hypothetical protein
MTLAYPVVSVEKNTEGQLVSTFQLAAWPAARLYSTRI